MMNLPRRTETRVRPCAPKMPRRLAAALVLLLLAATAAAAQEHDGAWFLHPLRHHVSVHGQIGCTECHPEQADKANHPGPPGSVMTPAPFDPETCIGCHDEVPADITQGLHGAADRPAVPDQDCQACHRPHTQFSPQVDAALAVAPAPGQPVCGLCHDPPTDRPSLTAEDRTCLGCHAPQDVAATARFCLHCHGAPATPGTMTGHLDPARLAAGPHASMDCRTCHPAAARTGHGASGAKDCTSCHLPHGEARAHDAHRRVACQACHLADVVPVAAAAGGDIGWRRAAPLSGPSQIHEVAVGPGQARCQRCHFAGNRLGAAAAVLPAKGVLCLACHTGSLTVADPVSVAALAILLIGLVSLAVFVAGGRRDAATDFSPWRALGALVADGLLQRRLLRQSPGRWAVHALIVFPFGLRFIWALAALAATRLAPAVTLTTALIDKNHPVNALFFDLSGLTLIAGVILAVWRGRRGPQPLPHLPARGHLATVLLAAVVLAGFWLEGLRIALTGFPPGTNFAVAGRTVAVLCARLPHLDILYGYCWYLHAALWGAFVALLPFGRMRQILTAPLAIALTAARHTDPPHTMERNTDR